MTTLTKGQLADTLTKHAAWLREERGGKRANLIGADLIGADLIGADLRGANLTGANLTEADLIGANLTEADLTRANLTEADLTRANLTGADLFRADLTGADIIRATLFRADLTGADLTGADLTGADIIRAHFAGASFGDGWTVNGIRDLLWVGPLGSRNDHLLYNVPTGMVRAGCFGLEEKKDLDAFAEAVKATHGDTVYAAEYLATVEYLRALTATRREARP